MISERHCRTLLDTAGHCRTLLANIINQQDYKLKLTASELGTRRTNCLKYYQEKAGGDSEKD